MIVTFLTPSLDLLLFRLESDSIFGGFIINWNSRKLIFPSLSLSAKLNISSISSSLTYKEDKIFINFKFIKFSISFFEWVLWSSLSQYKFSYLFWKICHHVVESIFRNKMIMKFIFFGFKFHRKRLSSTKYLKCQKLLS